MIIFSVMKEKDVERQTAEIRSKREWKEQQKKKRKRRKGMEDKSEEQEGPTYEPGLFGPDGKLLDLPTSFMDVKPAAKKARTCRSCNQPG